MRSSHHSHDNKMVVPFLFLFFILSNFSGAFVLQAPSTFKLHQQRHQLFLRPTLRSKSNASGMERTSSRIGMNMSIGGEKAKTANVAKGTPTRRSSSSSSLSREKTNREFRTKRLQDKMNRQLNKFMKIYDNGIVDGDDDKKDEIPTQANCDNLLAICAASNEWDTYEMVVDKMKQKGISIQRNSYGNMLKECYSQGNGVSAVKVLNLMQARVDSDDSMKPNQNDLKLAIGALCRNNKYEQGLWKKALQLIHASAAAIERGDMDVSLGSLHIDAYNEVLQCMENEKRWEEALDLLQTMEEGSEFHTVPNLATYHRVLDTLVSSSQVNTAVELLLSLSKEKGVLPTIYSFETVFSALLDKRQKFINLSQAVALLDSMHELKIAIPTVMFNRVIAACARTKQTNVARDLYRRMKAQKVQLDTVTYNSLISVAASTGRAKDALKLFQLCKEDTGVDIITYTNTIRACAKGRMSRKALELLQDAKDNSMPLDAFIYTATIDACAKARTWENAMKIMEDMEENNILPNQYTYSAAITACGNCGEWKQSLGLLTQMKDKNMKVGTRIYNAAITALSKGARQNIKNASDTNTDKQNLWILAFELLDEMKSKRIWPDVYTYSGVISTCASGGRYEEALNVIKTMQNGPPRVRPNKIAYTGAISACSRAGEWSHALKLFVNMKTDRIRCDVVAYNALMSAFANGGKADKCFTLWNDMCGIGTGEFSGGSETTSPDIITLTSVLASFDKIGWQDHFDEVDCVFAEAVKRHIVFSDTMDTKWEIDLSGMSLPVARAACRYILNQFRDTQNSEGCQDLSLITGIGRHHLDDSENVSTTTLREYIQEILSKDFDPPLESDIPERAAGVILVKRSSIERWLKSAGGMKA